MTELALVPKARAVARSCVCIRRKREAQAGDDARKTRRSLRVRANRTCSRSDVGNVWRRARSNASSSPALVASRANAPHSVMDFGPCPVRRGGCGGSARCMVPASSTWKSMQIILVSRTKKVPKTLDLASRRMRWRIGARWRCWRSVCVMSLGAALALAVASPRDRALPQINDLKQKVGEQSAAARQRQARCPARSGCAGGQAGAVAGAVDATQRPRRAPGADGQAGRWRIQLRPGAAGRRRGRGQRRPAYALPQTLDTQHQPARQPVRRPAGAARRRCRAC